jgi:predicted oxidoreductase
VGTNKPGRSRALSCAFEAPIDRQTWLELYTAALDHEVP